MTKIYGLIGYPLIHSFSEGYFNTKFQAEGIDARYINFELPDIGDLMEVVSEYPDLNGLNVTIPYKEQVLPYMDLMDDTAREIGAVNVIKFIKDNKGSLKFKGFNTDAPAFADTMRALLTPDRKRALILGTGGASKAVDWALKSLGVETMKVSRTAADGVITYADLTEEVIHDHLIIVNTTPLGMFPDIDSCPDIPYQYLTPKHLCYDLLYNPDTTLFMKKSASHGAETKNGLEMLLLQAFESWNIWTNS